MLTTAETLDSATATNWLKTVQEFSPDGIVFSYNHGEDEVIMEYGTRQDEEFSHCYIVPLLRDITQEEARFIVDAWEYKYANDFDVEISNQYNIDGDYEIDIDDATKDSAITDMAKWHHNRWVHSMMKEGWHFGLYYSESKKSHPALREWDSLTDSHRRVPEFTNKDITEWLRLYNKI